MSNATLCTLALEPEIAGAPFGSLAPYALRADGTPFLLISSLAQHTANLRADPRCSLFVRDPNDAAGGDAQATWRVTVVARAAQLEASEPELEELYARYAERVPAAPSYGRTHDFSFFALEPLRVRAIGGFGAIRWLEPSAIRRDPLGGGWAEGGAFVIEHLNSDHGDAVRAIVARRTGVAPASAAITAVDRTGFLVRTQKPDALRHISFGREVEAREARDVFVALAKAARAVP